jgi:hypothetical protein
MTEPKLTPPPELVQQWVAEIWHEGTPVRVALSDEHIAARAAQWGADQELEAIIELAGGSALPEGDRYFDGITVASLRAQRRPKPPSLKEQALGILQRLSKDEFPCSYQEDSDWDTIRRALEALP